VRKGCASSSLLTCGWRVECPEGGMRSWGCYSPPAAWMAVAEGGGKGWRRPGAAVLLWEKPFPEGILITCNLMACLSTPPHHLLNLGARWNLPLMPPGSHPQRF